MPIRIFVYGTLLRGQPNHDEHLVGALYLGRAELSAFGLEMRDMGGFPALGDTGAGYVTVKGELYEVDPATLARLDRLAGVDRGLFKRKSFNVTAAGIPYQGVQVYLMPAARFIWPELNRVTGNDWRAYAAIKNQGGMK